MGIHYDYKSTRGMKAMEKAAKRERRLAEKKAKREAKEGQEGKKKEENLNKLDVQEPITLDFITNPHKDKWTIHKKMLSMIWLSKKI